MTTNSHREKTVNCVVFMCENSAYRAVDSLYAEQLSLPPQVQLIRVPCAGKVEETHILEALQNGVEGVLVIGCNVQNCEYQVGTERAQNRVERVGQLLQEIELDAGRVHHATVSGTSGKHLAEQVAAFVSELEQLDDHRGGNEAVST